MKCPHCDYVDDYQFDNSHHLRFGDNDALNSIEGDKGKFFTLSGCAMMYRHPDDSRQLYACPNCGKTFIEV